MTEAATMAVGTSWLSHNPDKYNDPVGHMFNIVELYDSSNIKSERPEKRTKISFCFSQHITFQISHLKKYGDITTVFV